MKSSAYRRAWFLALATWGSLSLGLAAEAGEVPAPPSSPTTVEALAAMAWDRSHAGEPLDLKGFALTFSDDFRRLDVTPTGGAGPWWAPIHGDVGASHFEAPGGEIDPYSVENGALRIRATRVGERWHGGHLQTMDRDGKGFAQKYGYFEARAKLPNNYGSWSAFWLKSANEYRDPTHRSTRAEIDVVEYYGADPLHLHSAVHLWPRGEEGALAKPWYKSKITPQGDLGQDFHLYGVLITPTDVIICLDRKEVARWPTLPEYRQELFMLFSLTLNKKEVADAQSPMDMYVDYARAYKLPPKVLAASLKALEAKGASGPPAN